MYLKTTQTQKKRGTSKSERKRLIKLLDDEVRRILRERDKLCCSCGKPINEKSQVSHYVTRRVYALRWDLKNVHMSCPGCNLRHAYDPIPYTRFMIDKYGKGILDYLFLKKNELKTMTTPKLRELLEELRK